MEQKKGAGNILERIFIRAGTFVGISGVYFITGFLNLMGYRNCLAFGERIGDGLYFISGMKKKVFHNLKLAFGDDISSEYMEKTARNVLRNFGKNWTELFFSVGPFINNVMDNITVEGCENLDYALAKGKGVIAVSAHLGNYPFIGTRLSKEGYHFLMVVRDLETAVGSAVYRMGREHLDLPSITTMPERQFYKESLRALKENGIIGLISDENKRHGGIFVDFFGRQASTAPGPAALALRTGASVVPIFIIRNQDNSQKVVIEKEIIWDQTGNTSKDMKAITEQFTRVIENYVRMDPEQWLWTNWRWRTQPWGQSNEAKLKKKRRLKTLKRIVRKE